MKKMLFLAFLFLVNIQVSKALEPKIIYQKDIYSNRMGDKVFSGQMGIIYLDNKLVYCIDPYLIVGKDYNLDNSYLSKISPEDLEYFEVVAYYGYNETNRNNVYYYMAAQDLIWERIIGKGNIYWSTEKYGMGNTISVDYYKYQIMEDVKNYYLRPEFENQLVRSSLFNTFDIYDNNYVIDEYSLTNNGKSIINVVDNKVTIQVLDSKENKIELKKTYASNVQTSLYHSNGSQTLIGLGLNRTIESGFTIKSYDNYSTYIGIKFYDKDTGELIKEPVNFEIYDAKGEFQYIKNYNYEDYAYKYVMSFGNGTYLINNLPSQYVNDPNLKFEVNEDIYMSKYTEYKIYIEKKKIEKEIVIEPSIKVKDNPISIVTTNDITNNNIGNNVITKPITNDKISKVITNNTYLDGNKINNESKPVFDKYVPTEDNLPNTYDYYSVTKLLLCSICLIGCGLYKI